MNSQHFLESLILNSNTEALDLTKLGKLFQTSVPLKCTEFVPYTVDFADGSDREGHCLSLYDKFLLLKWDHINLGFVLDTILKISVTRNLKCL